MKVVKDLDDPDDFIETYKIKIMRKNPGKKGTQYKKHIYTTKANFLRYGKDIQNRYESKSFYSDNLETYCEIYQMNTDSKWVKINTPEEWEI